MKSTGRAMRLSIFIGERHTWHHKPLYCEIVHRAHKAGLAGATVVQGVEGFGATARIHTPHLLPIGDDLPQLIVIVDAEERVRAFLPELEELMTGGLVTLDEVEVHRYTARRR
ncbi:DUF190 domain-containing protein [Kutzneria buriramensis]|uniref:Uncharacterized protein n=1 Tax=Kutzneria buriramensis TaxID=1045776 RepID=A0A3E0GUQ7_9PSEU|nr:DUF190 domain-containing protein [Kutzneria buriramensis]REH27669.1 hypothetical protein BCF44_12957 [Kutzneria buriramensis]